MVDALLLGTAAVTGGLLLAIVFAISRNRYVHPALQVQRSNRTAPSRAFARIDSWSTRPGMWFATFLMLTLGIGALSILAVLDTPANGALMALAGAITALGFVFGTYVAARNAGVSTAGSTFVTGTLIAVVVLLAVTALLLVW